MSEATPIEPSRLLSEDLSSQELMVTISNLEGESFWTSFHAFARPCFAFDVETLQIYAATDLAAEILRYDRLKLEALRLSDLWPDDEVAWRSEFMKVVAEVGRLDTASGVRFNLKCGDGAIIDTAISFSEMIRDSRRIRFVLIQKVVTRRAFASHN